MRYFRRRRRLVTPGTFREAFIRGAENANPTGVVELAREEVGTIAREYKELNLITPQDTAPRTHHNIDSYRVKKYHPRQIAFDPSIQRRPKKMPRVYKGTARASKYRANLGEKKRHIVRKHLVKISQTLEEDKTMGVVRSIYVPYNANEKVINCRNDNLINVSGVRIRRTFWFHDVDESLKKMAIRVRWALINPKTNDGAATFDISQFFRARNPVDSPYVPFTTGNGDAYDYQSSKINSEEFGVLKEGSFELRTDPAGMRYDRSAIKLLDVWVPIKRQLEFTDNTTEWPEENIYFVYWYTALNDAGTDKGFTGLGAALASYGENITYFTNSRLFN